MSFKTKQFDNLFVSAKYLNRFFTLHSAGDMLNMKLFPNIKEIAETVSMFTTVEDIIMKADPSITADNSKVTVVIVGDGKRPRTGAFFAYMTKWDVISVDPNMTTDNEECAKFDEIQRLVCIKNNVENIINNRIFESDEPVIIIYPHSHAPVKAGWDKFPAKKKWLIKLECCTKDKLEGIPFLSFRDKHAITKANQIFIWSNYMTPMFQLTQ